MGLLSVDTLLGDYSPDAPSGAKLDELEYQSFETSTKSKPETQFGPAQDPDWRAVKDLGAELVKRSRDLRVFVKLSEALLHTEGWAGFADAIEVVQGSLERHWETLYPELDAADNNDPWERLQAVGELSDKRLVQSIKERSVVATPMTGSFSLLDIQRSEGHAPVPDGESAPDSAIVNGAFMDVDLETLEGTNRAIARASDALESVRSTLQEKAGDAPDLGPISGVVRELKGILAERLSRRGVGEAPAGDSADGAPAGAATAPPAPRPDQINSREDVIRVIDKVCDYFQKNEPSSPVPMLLRRAKRLVNKDFFEVLQDLTPNAVHEAEVFRGTDEEASG